LQEQHLPLDHLAASAALVLDDVESQKHDANQTTPSGIAKKGGRSTLKAFRRRAPLIRFAFLAPHPLKIAVDGSSW